MSLNGSSFIPVLHTFFFFWCSQKEWVCTHIFCLTCQKVLKSLSADVFLTGWLCLSPSLQRLSSYYLCPPCDSSWFLVVPIIDNFFVWSLARCPSIHSAQQHLFTFYKLSSHQNFKGSLKTWTATAMHLWLCTIHKTKSLY